MQEVEDSIGDLILSDAIAAAAADDERSRRHAAACRAFQYLTGQCHRLLKSCLGGNGNGEFAARDQLDYHKVMQKNSK